MQLTPYNDINDLISILLGKIQQILDKKFVGLYLYGSLAVGDFDYEISDIDLLAATATDIDEKEFDALKKMQETVVKNNNQWENRLEIAYLSQHALKTFKTQTSQAAIISPGEPFHFKEAGKHWLIDWYAVQQNGITLFGPEPKTLIDPISKKEFIEAVREHSQSFREWINHQQDRNGQAYVILTLCRALYAVENGRQVSKKQAALWLQNRFPQWAALIQKALAWRAASLRKEEIDHQATMPETTRFVRFTIEQITF